MTRDEYYAECISDAAHECGLTMTEAQLKYIAKAVEGAAENVDMAFYSPPPSDRYNEIEREWKGRLKALESEFEAYRANAETAVKRALRQYSDSVVSIGEHGDVFRHGGRTDRIQ